MTNKSTSIKNATASAVEAARAAHAHAGGSQDAPAVTVSATMREYLAEIYRLQGGADGATTSALAERLEVSPSAVVRMLRRLDETGLLKHTPYHGVELSPEGTREALRGIRRHRLLEVFLVKVMRFGWDEVHTEAHGLDAGMTDAFEDRMDQLCDFPTHCPHGDPIPTRDGKITLVEDAPLLEATVGQVATVSRVKSDEPAKLRYLAELGLVPGAPIDVLGRAPFNGPMRLKVGAGRDAREHVIGSEVARCLRIR
jgi:DtxR family transcriptional regulator, Mn-dependent transcriptional regulator